MNDFGIAYLFVDGIAERLRPRQWREAVLAALGVAAWGRRILLHLIAGSRENAETVTSFYHDVCARGLGDPLRIIFDGASEIIKAIEICFPR